MNTTGLWTINANILIMVGVWLVVFFLFWIAFYKQPSSSKNLSKRK